MSGPFGSQQWMYSSGFYPHEIGNSARFDTNSYISRTPSSTGNRKTYTISTWVKFCKFPGAVGQAIWAAGVSGARVMAYLYNETLNVNRYDGTYVWSLQTDKLFRDPSAWYHIVIAIDTTDSTASDRVKIYVNGDRVTTFKTTPVYPALNLDTYANNTVLHTHGASPYNSLYLNGYLAEINFIDGTALTADSFGETKADTWIPKKYTGSYGTNGYYLDFATRATDPIDASDNGNNFGSVNVVSTDWMLDSPTNNWATLNSISGISTNPAYSEGNLKFVNAAGAYAWGYSTIPLPKTGKWVFEVLFQASALGVSPWVYNSAGVTTDPQLATYATGNATTYLINDHGGSGSQVFVEAGSEQGSHNGITAGTVVQVQVDCDNNEMTFNLNGTQQTQAGSTVDIPSDVTLYPITGEWNNQTFVNFGQDSSFAGNKTAQGNTDANGRGDFYYAPPAGYLALCSANMPDPVAAINPAVNNSPQDHFNTILWTGDGTDDRAITGVGFQPDLTWVKGRSAAEWHNLYDAVRGANKGIYPNDTYQEETLTDTFESFDSDGFTVGYNSSYSNVFTNKSSTTYVAWNWKAGGTGVSNTVGGLTSTVLANQDIGMSIVTFTTDGTNTTAGTGLSSSAPLDMVIIKRRDSASEWQVGHRSSGQGVNFAYHLELNSNAALSGSGPYFMGTQASSNGDRVYLASGTYGVSSATWVAYCFQEVEGFSKFGSYTGNGNADGPFIQTGFKPAFVMVKRADSTGDWVIYNNKSNPYNVVDKYLMPHNANTEATSSSEDIDFLSNGFKVRGTWSGFNASSGTIIYMAFAEMPFKYANAR